MEILKDKTRLLEREYYYFKKFKMKSGVYNKANPFDTIRQGWNPQKDSVAIVKGKTWKDYPYTHRMAMKYFKENLFDEIELIREHLRHRFYFKKKDVDQWLIEKIKDKDLSGDERIKGLLIKYYNAVGISVVYSSMFEEELVNRDIKCELNEWILMDRDFYKLIARERKNRLEKRYLD